LGKNGYAVNGISKKLVGNSGFTNIGYSIMACAFFWNNK
jgi:hypothetical protein